jgi:hypothetical protein
MFIKNGIFFQALLPICIAVSCYGVDPESREKTKSLPMEQGTAFIELFTSEGCSSCPPADRLLSKIAREKGKDVFVLSYHVDYWDNIGWKDPFSQAVFSNRQRHYAQRFSSESVYTPQVVVNGVEEFVGSNETKLRSSIAKSNHLTPLDIQATRKDNSTIVLAYSIENKSPLSLNFALVKKEATSVVKRGENSGRTLHHVNIVNGLKTFEPKSEKGTTEINFPSGSDESEFEIIAFTQQEADFTIKSAVRIPVPSSKTEL